MKIWMPIPDEELLLKSNNSLGHGIMGGHPRCDLCKTDGYSASIIRTIAYDMKLGFSALLDEGKLFIIFLLVRTLGKQ